MLGLAGSGAPVPVLQSRRWPSNARDGQALGRMQIGRAPSVCVRALFGRKPSTSGEGKPCRVCKSKGSVTCPGCKGSGRNKKDGNVFERYKCYQCQGFGLIACKACGGKGLTPEQRGER